MRIEDSIEIAAPAATVWAITTDLERLPEWSPGFTSVDRLTDDEELVVGTAAAIKQATLPRTEWTVTEVQAGRRFVWGTRMRGMDFVATHEVSPGEASCTNRLVLEVSGGASKVLGPLLGPVLRRQLGRENAALKQRAETWAPD